MTHPDIRAALGRERLNTLLPDAEAAREARQARLHRRQTATSARRGSPLRRRAGSATRAVLRDGSGIQRFTALVAADNAAVAGLLHRMRAHLIRHNPGTAEYQISLSPGLDGPQAITEGLEDNLRRCGAGPA
jgi:hypothetical protein